MAIANIVKRGVGFSPGTLKWIPTAGYGIGDITIGVSPFGPIVAVNSVTTFTATVPADWSVTAGSLVVAGDFLSADYTAPASAQLVTLTVTDRSNPGNTINDPIDVTTSGPTGAGAPDVYTMTPSGKVGRSIVGV